MGMDVYSREKESGNDSYFRANMCSVFRGISSISTEEMPDTTFTFQLSGI